MRLKLLTVVLGGALLALAVGACGEESPVASSPTTVTHSQAPQSVPGQAATLNPVFSSSQSAVDPTYSRRSAFVPLDQPAFLTTNESGYLPDEDLVLGLEWMGEARAYPIRMLTYHHIVNDTVAGRPLLVTY